MKRIVTSVVAFVAVALTLSGCFSALPIPIWPPETQKPKPDVSSETGGYEQQKINWRRCGDGFRCAKIVAPLDWNNIENTSTIELNLLQHRATGNNKLGTLFVNPGGPGASGTAFLRASLTGTFGTTLLEHFDIVAWDPRGVEGSSAVKCLSDRDFDDYLFGDPRPISQFTMGSDEWIAAVREEQRAFGEACAAETGDLLGHIDTVSTVRDLELLRVLVGDETLHYLGFSYGTSIGSLYAHMYPQRVGRLVLDGAISHDVPVNEVVLIQQKGFEASLRAYLADCLGRTGCPFSGTVDSAMAEVGELLDQVHANPLHAPDLRWVSSDTFLTAIILPLYHQSNWRHLDGLFYHIQHGTAASAQELADLYYGRDYHGHYEDNSTEAFMAINCLDYPRITDVAVMRENAQRIAEVAPTIGRYSGYGELACLDWPYPPATLPANLNSAGAAPILVIGTTGDPATPYEWAVEMAEKLESGVLVTFNGEQHTAYDPDNTCVANVVENYFVRGKVPAADPNC